ncbi:MAG: hypothetical protein MI863_12955, partial [Desulfobacterales bacterium]|nr:hypothetical protein [Desulfobacterales bacterium]
MRVSKFNAAGAGLPRVITLAMLAAAVFGLTGCATVGPDYHPPRQEMAEDWHTTVDPALLPSAELVQHWWRLFDDPLLNEFIETASRNNKDLLTAILRVEE